MKCTSDIKKHSYYVTECSFTLTLLEGDELNEKEQWSTRENVFIFIFYVFILSKDKCFAFGYQHV